jgi:hypothetical protein
MKIFETSMEMPLDRTPVRGTVVAAAVTIERGRAACPILTTFHVVAKLRAVTSCAGMPPNCDHPVVVRVFGRRISRDLRGE